MRTSPRIFSATPGGGRRKPAAGSIGVLPMHFPGELAHAAGALPVILQEDDEPITIGQKNVFNFYCGFNRSLIDQALRGKFSGLDAIMFGDHCVQLLGTADVIRANIPGLPILFNQLCSIIDAEWALPETERTFQQLWKELETLIGRKIDEADVRASIRLFNRDRELMRRLYEMRRNGQIALTGRQMQAVVKSSMVMDKAQHCALLETLLTQERPEPSAAQSRAGVPVRSPVSRA